MKCIIDLVRHKNLRMPDQAILLLSKYPENNCKYKYEKFYGKSSLVKSIKLVVLIILVVVALT